MQPAFSSRRQATAFGALVAALLLLPYLLSMSRWPAEQNVYATIPVRYGPFSWIRKNIDVETSDIDVAFLGSSHVWCDIDTLYVQEAFSASLGNRAEVVTLGWPWAGFDVLYLTARDLLTHRRVRTLVIYDESSAEDVPHPNSSRLFRIGDDAEAIESLPWLERIRVYGGAVLGEPRPLLGLLRPEFAEEANPLGHSLWETSYQAPPIAERRGALRSGLGFNYNRALVAPAVRGRASGADVIVFGSDTQGSFAFTGPPLAPYQLHFALALAKLCQERGTELVVLNTPTFSGREQEAVTERVAWPEVLGPSVRLLGIPPAKLFAGMTANDVSSLFYEDGHLNRNGQDVFTPVITPALLKLYGHATNR